MSAEIDDIRKYTTKPQFALNFSEYGQVKAVHFSSYEWSQNILLLSFVKRVLVLNVNIQDELEYEKISELTHNDEFNLVVLSPETTTYLPIHLEFCVSGKKGTLTVYKGDTSNNYTSTELLGHTGYINDISYDYENKYVASASDDLTVKLWNMHDYKCYTTIYLTSPGVNVCWHRDENLKLLVAEKSGTIRFYNVETRKPIMSINYGRTLSSAHWFHGDSQIISSLQMGELLIWDLTRTSCPILSSGIFTELGGQLKFSPSLELVALVNRVENVLQVVQIRNKQQRLVAKVNVPSNLTWHFRLPFVCIGDDSKVLFWKVFAK